MQEHELMGKQMFPSNEVFSHHQPYSDMIVIMPLSTAKKDYLYNYSYFNMPLLTSPSNNYLCNTKPIIFQVHNKISRWKLVRDTLSLERDT